ncbi:MAG: hypothetical protein ACLTVV_08420 [Ruminococcus sp.]
MTRKLHSSENAAKEGADLLYTLGTEGYFQGGFLSTDYTAAADLFFGGNGAMWYSGSGQITQASEMYKNGQLGFFCGAGCGWSGKYGNKCADSWWVWNCI